MSQAVQILEHVTGAPGRVDREAGVVHDVKVLGLRSANGRRYLPEAIEKAVKLYEGRAVNVNHPARPGEQRSAYDRFGWLEGLYLKDGELYARKLHYLKSHGMAGPVAEAAERRPELFGLSHNARGRERRVAGEAVIESIEDVVSVDLVADPATVKSLHEGRTMPQTLKDVLESLKGKPQAVALKEMADAAGLSPDAAMAGGTEKPDDAIKSGFKAAIHAVVDDDGMDMSAKLKKIKEILKAQEKLMGGGESKPAEKPADTAEGKAQGDANLREQLEQLKRKDRARELCEAANVRPSPALLKALVAMPDEADVKALIEENKGPPARPGAGGTGGARPKSAERAPLTRIPEARDGKPAEVGQAPEDGKALAGWLNSK